MSNQTSQRTREARLRDQRDKATATIAAQQQQIKRLEQLVFAYESVNTPINPLVQKCADQQQEIEALTAERDRLLLVEKQYSMFRRDVLTGD